MRHGQRWDETWHRLREWTSASGAAERLAAQVLLDQGFTDLDPSHPLGGRDGTADALAQRNGKKWVMAVYFPRGQRSFNDIKTKFVDDFAGVASNGADALAFVTNQELRRAQRKTLADAVSGPVEIFHLERLVAVLDQPRWSGLREQFLGITLPRGLERDERLDELWRASVGRCEARWLSVGLSELEAATLAADPEVGRAADELLPSETHRLVAWTAPMGSGKSIAAERHHQEALEYAAANNEAPLPAYLSATECTSDLVGAVQRATAELGQARLLGAIVVVDGVDELGEQATDKLLLQARTLVRTWPHATALITSRSVPALIEAPEHRPLPPLTFEQQEECLEIGAGEGRRMSIHALAAPIKATLKQPMFALLAGLWMRERTDAPTAPIDLMRLLGERATRGLSVDQSKLRTLATMSVARELGPVSPSEIGGDIRMDELLATGMLARRDGGLVFVLPAVAQWFAAQAILLGDVDVAELLEVPADLELWRYPLALVVSLGSAGTAETVLDPVLDQQPGFALRVLDAAFGQAVLGGATPPPWREGGRQVRATLQTLADALGPLAQLVLPADETGRILPIGVGSTERHLTIAPWIGPESRPDVFELPADLNVMEAGPGWHSLRMATVGPGATWAWSWSLGGVRRRADRLIRERGLPLTTEGPLADEEVWAAACAMLGESVISCREIAPERILDSLARYPEDHFEYGAVIDRRNGLHDLRGLRIAVTRAKERGIEALHPPYPVADLARIGGGLIGDLYSDECLVRFATAVYEAALIGYRTLVERWFPTLLPALEHYVLRPVRIEGFVIRTPASRGDTMRRMPHLAGYMEALAPTQADELHMRYTDRHYDFSVGEHIYAQQRRARPEAARWITASHGGMSLEVGRPYPISEVVYRWLGADLKLLGLVGSPSWDRSGDAMAQWEI